MNREAAEMAPRVELYPGVINETINRALGMEALFSLQLIEEE